MAFFFVTSDRVTSEHKVWTCAEISSTPIEVPWSLEATYLLVKQGIFNAAMRRRVEFGKSLLMPRLTVEESMRL